MNKKITSVVSVRLPSEALRILKEHGVSLSDALADRAAVCENPVMLMAEDEAFKLPITQLDSRRAALYPQRTPAFIEHDLCKQKLSAAKGAADLNTQKIRGEIAAQEDERRSFEAKAASVTDKIALLIEKMTTTAAEAESRNYPIEVELGAAKNKTDDIEHELRAINRVQRVKICETNKLLVQLSDFMKTARKQDEIERKAEQLFRANPYTIASPTDLVLLVKNGAVLIFTEGEKSYVPVQKDSEDAVLAP